MGRKQKAFTWIATGVAIAVVAVRIHNWRASSTKPIMFVGAVLSDNPDPAKQSPIANVTVSAIDSSYGEATKSDASGLFRLAVHHGLLPGPPVTLRFEHAEYQPRDITTERNDRLYVVRLEPIRQPVLDHTENPTQAIRIKNIRVRYSLKNETTVNVGSLAKQFEVKNTGDVPCHGQHPCSPDGKWKAATSTLSLDAQKGNEYRNVRVSCVAGPCPFTRLQPADFPIPARKIELTALDWSDTASFLVEAEVTRTMTTDKVLQSYPFVTGQTMTFALPGDAEGPSVVADLNENEIVFPLGANLILSWATCSVEIDPGRNKIYRCELKPGYQFQ